MSDEPQNQTFKRISVDIAKLRDYCLSLLHPRGRNKARVFRSRLGLTAADAELIRQALIRAVHAHPADLLRQKRDQHGVHYRLDFALATATGTGTVRSIWLLRVGQDELRLVTCYLL